MLLPLMLPLLVQMLFQILPASCSFGSAERSGVRVLENQTFSKTLFILWDVRLFHKPEFNENTSVTLKFNDSASQLTVEFAAFNRQWRLATSLNSFLLPETLPTELRRATDGVILEKRLRGSVRRDLWQPLRGRLYLGTADAGTTEQGWAAVTLIGDGIRAYVATNINDYMLNVPIANQTVLKSLANALTSSKRSNRAVRETSGEINRQPGVGEINRQSGGGGGEIHRQPGVGGGGEINRQPDGGGGEINRQPDGGGGEINRQPDQAVKTNNESRPAKPNPHLAKRTDFVNLGRLPQLSNGREIYAEFGVIIDQTWLESLTMAYGIGRDSALVFTAELLHYAQVWYLHPTLGYRLWLRVSDVTVLNGSHSAPDKMEFEKFCSWQARLLRRDLQTDFVVLLTGDKRHCNGLGGVAYPSEACNSKMKDRQCACVFHQKLQVNTLIRAIAHEIGHLIGMPDDYAGRSSELCFSGLMRYGLYEDSGWSTCAVQNLERFLFIEENTCLHASQTPSLTRSPPPPRLPLNTAWRAPAWQSSTANDDEHVWGAWKATDGHIFGVPYENTGGSTENLLGHLGSCSQTESEHRPWLVIQLDNQSGNSSLELQVHVYGREECCEHSLSNLSIGIGDQRLPYTHNVCRTFDNSDHFGKYKLLSFKCPAASGKFLSIQSTSNDNTSLSICEVYVFQDKQPQPFSHAGETCFDKARYCDEWKMAGDCDTANRQSCRRTCGLCGPAARPEIDRPRLRGQPLQPLPQRQPLCRDSHRYCRFFAANGLCEERWPHCPLACNRCDALSPAPTTQLNTQQQAITIATTIAAPSSAAMATSPTEAMPTAAVELQQTEQPVCRDCDPDCRHWASALYCQFPHIADRHCRKSCGTC